VSHRVRVTPEFFSELDAQLPAEREGRVPSRSDFQARELLRLVRTFEEDWDDLPHLPGHEEYRILIVAGQLVRVISVTGRLAADGVVELVQIGLDLSWPSDPEPDPDEDPDR
jgi:hypothetical protein